MILPVEDEVSDILSKAQKGQEISTEALAERSGLSESVVRAARRGEADEATLAAMARGLGLKENALIRLSRGDWRPREVAPIEGFEMVCSPFHQWQVNAFLLWDQDSRRAVAFDTGTDATPLVESLKGKGLELEAILLTHGHWDHREGLAQLRTTWPHAITYLSAKERDTPVEAERVTEGFRYELGRFRIEGFDTPGHTRGGMTFVIEGLPRKVAVVGDALFAGSMGGANVSYAAGLESVRRILQLDGDTVLAPGHGPLTTVAEEKEMNCFAVNG